jgi:xanthosine utilization system XapX-like protein
MGPETSLRVGILIGVVSALSWFLFAKEDLASPVNSLVAGIIGFMVTYAFASLIVELTKGNKNRRQ